LVLPHGIVYEDAKQTFLTAIKETGFSGFVVFESGLLSKESSDVYKEMILLAKIPQ
jgi:hypothetical protein